MQFTLWQINQNFCVARQTKLQSTKWTPFSMPISHFLFAFPSAAFSEIQFELFRHRNSRRGGKCIRNSARNVDKTRNSNKLNAESTHTHTHRGRAGKLQQPQTLAQTMRCGRSREKCYASVWVWDWVWAWYFRFSFGVHRFWSLVFECWERRL